MVVTQVTGSAQHQAICRIRQTALGHETLLSQSTHHRRYPMKNKRKKRKHITPQHRPVISKAIDTVTPPFIHNLLCIVLPKGIFQSVDHYEAFVNKVIETEDIPDRYGTLYLCCTNPKCNRVIFNIKSDLHSHKEQFCYYSQTP